MMKKEEKTKCKDGIKRVTICSKEESLENVKVNGT